MGGEEESRVTPAGQWAALSAGGGEAVVGAGPGPGLGSLARLGRVELEGPVGCVLEVLRGAWGVWTPGEL